MVAAVVVDVLIHVTIILSLCTYMKICEHLIAMHQALGPVEQSQ